MHEICIIVASILEEKEIPQRRNTKFSSVNIKRYLDVDTTFLERYGRKNNVVCMFTGLFKDVNYLTMCDILKYENINKG